MIMAHDHAAAGGGWGGKGQNQRIKFIICQMTKKIKRNVPSGYYPRPRMLPDADVVNQLQLQVMIEISMYVLHQHDDLYS